MAESSISVVMDQLLISITMWYIWKYMILKGFIYYVFNYAEISNDWYVKSGL